MNNSLFLSQSCLSLPLNSLSLSLSLSTKFDGGLEAVCDILMYIDFENSTLPIYACIIIFGSYYFLWILMHYALHKIHIHFISGQILDFVIQVADTFGEIWRNRAQQRPTLPIYFTIYSRILFMPNQASCGMIIRLSELFGVFERTDLWCQMLNRRFLVPRYYLWFRLECWRRMTDCRPVRSKSSGNCWRKKTFVTVITVQWQCASCRLADEDRVSLEADRRALRTRLQHIRISLSDVQNFRIKDIRINN